MPDRDFVIWSFEHSAWWGPNCSGYVPDLDRAGRYTKEEAGDIVTSSVLLEEVAMYTTIAEQHGPPKYHPYRGVPDA